MGMKRMLLLLGICTAAAVPASGQTKVKTSVEKVTLFIDGAQVTRSRQIDIPAGNSTVVFTGLSPYLDDKSMQVAAKGKFTVTAVNRLFNHTDSLERSTRQKALEQELAKIRQQQQQQQKQPDDEGTGDPAAGQGTKPEDEPKP